MHAAPVFFPILTRAQIIVETSTSSERLMTEALNEIFNCGRNHRGTAEVSMGFASVSSRFESQYVQWI